MRQISMAWDVLSPHVKCGSVQVNDGPCVTYVGPGGAGNFVKMVHNGIEYGDMQLISEAYDVLRTVGGLTNEEMVEAFNEWNAVRNKKLSFPPDVQSLSHMHLISKSLLAW